MKKFTLQSLKDKQLYIGFAVLGLMCLALSLLEPSSEVAPEVVRGPSVDTFIPKDKSLLPVEIANAESLSSVIGDVGGVVDLYLASTPERKGGKKVGSRIKLVRAPLNPDQFFVMVTPEQGQILMEHTGPFIAVVQNPDSRGTHITQSAKQRVRIEYQN